MGPACSGRRRGRRGLSDLTTAALVAYGFAGASVLSAAVASGFVATELLERIRAGDEGVDTYHMLAWYTGLVNQGFAKVHVAASSAAILLWSADILRGRRITPAAGAAGIVVGGVVLIGLLSGHLRLDLHGFGIITVAQSGWLIWLGVLMIRHGHGRVESNPS